MKVLEFGNHVQLVISFCDVEKAWQIKVEKISNLEQEIWLENLNQVSFEKREAWPSFMNMKFSKLKNSQKSAIMISQKSSGICFKTF